MPLLATSAVAVTASVTLGVVFVVSGVAKLASPSQWRAQSAGLGVPWWLARPVPAVEVVLGALLVAQVARVASATAAAALLVAFSAVLAARLAAGQHPPCACFGSLSSRPIGIGHLARNAVFLALAVVAVLA